MKILFIFHEAELSGASILLYRMVKWLSENTSISLSFLLMSEGPLMKEINELGRIYFWEETPPRKRTISERILNRIVKLKSWQDLIVDRLEKENFDVVYANTILASEVIIRLAHFKCKKIWHIHELELAISIIGKEHLNAGKYVDLFIANSQSTYNNLVECNIDKERIRIVYPVIDIKSIDDPVKKINLRVLLGIPEAAFIIGTSGTGIDRKGINSFIHLPIIVDHLLPGNKFYYLWVGKIINSEIIDHDLKKSGLTGRVIFSGKQKNPIPYYNIFDIYISCSKEESFGLSAIEAAALGKPVFCFEKTGGLEEIVKGADNITVKYMNIIEMAKNIIDFHNDRDELTGLGKSASEYSKNFDQDLIMGGFTKLITGLCSNLLKIIPGC